MEMRANARQAERDKRKEAAARRREPVVQASSRAFAAKSRNAWLDADDVNEGLGRLEDDWSEEEDIWDDDKEEWRVAGGGVRCRRSKGYRGLECGGARRARGASAGGRVPGDQGARRRRRGRVTAER